MPFIVQELIEGNPKIVDARPSETIQAILPRMIEHDYSQLPVVDEVSRPLGLITSESILRALSNFGVGLDQLRVEHASIKAAEFRSDADLFELLDRLQHTFAVLIVDGERKLTGIVTSYDTAAYFRRRAEDLMLVEDIESMIKDFITAPYQLENGQIDEAKMSRVLQQISDGGNTDHKKFRKAVSEYLALHTKDPGASPDHELLNGVINKHFKNDRPPLQFDKLTLYNYIELLLHQKQWQNYQTIFNLDSQALRTLLHRVRDTRNALAHFRGDITAAQRDHLRFTASWLAQYQGKVAAAFGGAQGEEEWDTAVSEPKTQEIAIEPRGTEAEQILPMEDEAEPNESRYAPLAIWLQNQPPKKDLVKPTFAQIEEIIRGELPSSAYNHRAWWANDPVGHVQSQQWLDVGWRVASVNMTTQVVRFARVQERQKAYIHFYSQLIDQFKKEPGYDYLRNLPDGTSWYWTRSAVIDEQHLGSFNFAFGRGNVLRVELYMDSGYEEVNKHLFDLLYDQKSDIEAELGCELRWQRLNNRRASRIACILPGSITDSEEELAALREKAIPTMVAFTSVLHPRVLKLGQVVLAERMKETE
ncbi:MAG: DUF4268 domain-containing protein [Anaerolineae bacterium]|nr:DUF4268 domain-containing protein [Anaerolineae bacterium]